MKRRLPHITDTNGIEILFIEAALEQAQAETDAVIRDILGARYE